MHYFLWPQEGNRVTCKKIAHLVLSEQMAHLLAFIGCIFPLLKHRGISHLQVGWAKIVKILYRIFISLSMLIKVATTVDLSPFSAVLRD